MRDAKANISHVVLNPYLSLKTPPSIGAIKQPVAYDVLNNPELRSDTYSLRYSSSSGICSFSLTTSMISASKGTKMKETEKPARLLPTSIRGIDYGKWKSWDGPNIRSDKNDIIKAN